MFRRLGLRSQLVLALSVAFVIAFSLLGVAAVQLGRHGREHARRDAAETTAQLFARALGPNPDHGQFSRASETLLGSTIRGVELERPAGDPWIHGVTRLGPSVEVAHPDGTLRLWLRPANEGGGASANLLLLYVSVTGAAILLLTYLALTYLIVRPVESLTQASERVARGQLHVRVPVRGAAEVARLAGAFNAMSEQLADERAALVARLEELERTTRDLESAERQVERSAHLASVGRLAAGVAHEIGNPLTAIAGLVELARDTDLPEARRFEFLSRVQKESERIHKIIRDLLDFARDEGQSEWTGEGPDDGSASDLAGVVAAAVRLVAPQTSARGLRIEQRLMDAPPVRGDADRLTQVALNLLLNAADAVDGDGEVVVEVRPDGDAVVLSVADSGPGIPEDILPHLFEPFVTSKPVGRGTGLGLAVSHTIIDRLGGTITASNPPEGGARFDVRIPIRV